MSTKVKFTRLNLTDPSALERSDASAGLIIFDNSTGRIYAGNKRYGSKISDASYMDSKLKFTFVDDSSFSVDITSASNAVTTDTSLISGHIVLGHGDHTVTDSSYVVSDGEITQSSSTTIFTGSSVWNLVQSAIDSEVRFKGCTSVQPTTPAPEHGDLWKATAAFDLDTSVAVSGDASVKVNDTIIYKDSSTSGTNGWYIIHNDTDTNTWRAVKVNGTQIQGNGISTGDLSFGNGSLISASNDGSTIKFNHSESSVGTDASVNGLYKITVDKYGHVTNAVSYTPTTYEHIFSKVSVTGKTTSDSAVDSSSSAVEITADSSVDTLTINSGNKWIDVSANSSTDSVIFGHVLSDASGSADASKGDASHVAQFKFDKAGHIISISEVAIDFESHELTWENWAI